MIVVWDDAWKSGTLDVNPDTVTELHEPECLETAGWVVRDDEKGIMVANERPHDHTTFNYRGASFIPRGMILEVNDYNLTKPRARKALTPEVVP